MFSLAQKGKLNFGTLRLDDALHLFRRIPDGHISATSAWSTAGRRRTDVNEHFLRFSRKTKTAKVSVQCSTIKGFCHGFFLPQTISQCLFSKPSTNFCMR